VRTTSMREMIVPESFDAHRTNANTLPGAKLTTRVRRLKTRSSAIQPKRIRCSIRFSSQVSSTRVSAASARALGTRRPKGGVQCASPSQSGNSRPSRSRSTPATVSFSQKRRVL
jgi:hypothetical protein